MPGRLTASMDSYIAFPAPSTEAALRNFLIIDAWSGPELTIFNGGGYVSCLGVGPSLAVRYAGLAPVRRGFALAAGLLLGLVAFGFGMTGQAVALPDSLRSLVFDVLPGSYVTVGATFTVGATVLIECLAAEAMASADGSTQRTIGRHSCAVPRRTEWLAAG